MNVYAYMCEYFNKNYDKSYIGKRLKMHMLVNSANIKSKLILLAEITNLFKLIFNCFIYNLQKEPLQVWVKFYIVLNRNILRIQLSFRTEKIKIMRVRLIQPFGWLFLFWVMTKPLISSRTSNFIFITCLSILNLECISKRMRFSFRYSIYSCVFRNLSSAY